MPSFDGFSALIHVEQKRVFEYEKRVNEEERATTCYVECETGMKFTVKWRVPSRGAKAYLINLFVDGRFIDDCVSCSSSWKRNGQFDGMWVDENRKSPFVFADPKFTSGDGSSSGGMVTDVTDDVGTIYVEMVEVRVCNENADEFDDEDVDRMRPEMALKTKSIPEEKAGLLTHMVISVQEKAFRVKRPSNCYFEEYPDPRPITSFTFRYRSDAFLRASGIKRNYGAIRRSPRKRKSRSSSSDTLCSEPAGKKKRTTQSEDEVELKLEGPDEDEDSEEIQSANGDDTAIPNDILSLTERQIEERKGRIAREKAALEKEERILETQRRRMLRAGKAKSAGEVVIDLSDD